MSAMDDYRERVALTQQALDKANSADYLDSERLVYAGVAQAEANLAMAAAVLHSVDADTAAADA
jgi:hypothetical protein